MPLLYEQVVLKLRQGTDWSLRRAAALSAFTRTSGLSLALSPLYKPLEGLGCSGA